MPMRKAASVQSSNPNLQALFLCTFAVNFYYNDQEYL